MCLFPCLDRIEEQKGILLIELFIHETDQICDNLASLLVIDSLDGLVARIGNLFCIFRKLDLRDKFACVTVLDGSQLINAAEGRAVLGGDEVCADTPGRDGSALNLQAVDQVFIQIVGGGDDCIRESGVIQHLAGFLGNICKVAAVEADAVESQRDTGVAHLLEDADRVRNTGTQGIIGIG